MRTFDPTPFWRSAVGFDRVFDLMNESSRWPEVHYPPYNIERSGPDNYTVTLAVAGFTPAEISITAEHNALTVEGAKAAKPDGEFLYQGITARPFKRVFSLADYVQVKAASLEQGLLRIELVREVPEALKPRKITIGGGSHPSIDHRKAA